MSNIARIMQMAGSVANEATGWSSGQFDYTAYSYYGTLDSSFSDTVSIGSEDSNRWLLIAAFGDYFTGAQGITITVGGSSTTELLSWNDTNSRDSYLVFSKIAYPTGTTETIQVDYSSDTYRKGFAVWRVIGEPSLYDSGTNYTGGNTASTLVDCVSGGATIGACFVQNKNTPVWTGVTEDFSYTNGSGEFWTGGSVLTASAETDKNIQVDATSTGTDYIKLIAASFEKA